MKTIKERAVEKYCTHCGARTEYNCSAEQTPCPYIKDYIKIATEQRAIDDDLLRDLKKMVVDKACAWLKARNVLTDASLQGFRNAMEKEI